MERLQIIRNNSVDWRPSAVLALATSPDGSQVAAAREDGSVEVWLVSPGSVGWHCQLTINGNPSSRVSSMVWLPSNLKCGGRARLLSSSIDGSVSEWDFSLLQQKLLALACDDSCVRLYSAETDDLTYRRSSPRVSGRILSVTWSFDAKLLFAGSSDGLIRCWNASTFQEFYRVTVGLGGLGSGPELCILSLLFLRCGTLVSGDSSGSVQFWDSKLGTLLQAHTYHQGDVNALATAPSNNRLFSAGSDGQVILYKRTSNANDLDDIKLSADIAMNWIYVSYIRAHTHDVRALTMAFPISSEVSYSVDKASKKPRHKRSVKFTYHKWAHLGVPMLISGGDDTKLFAYSAQEFTKFSPHDICPAPQRVLVQMVHNTVIDGASMVLAQHDAQLDVLLVKSDHTRPCGAPIGRKAISSYSPYFPYVSDVKSAELVHIFLPQRKENDISSMPSEPPITRMFASSDGQWLAAINCFGDIYVFNLETCRQHWFISRLDGASVTAGSFPPTNSNVMVITTSLNQVYVLDVEEKQFGEWSRNHSHRLPRRFQEFPGEVIGMSFPPSTSTSVIIYSSRAMCLIDFEMPIDVEDELHVADQLSSNKTKRKRKFVDQNGNLCKKKNFDLCAFKDPVFFVGHLSDNSLFVLEKQWVDVIKNLDAPVHKHIYGT
ncbi:hypothetical protein HPP92_002981 [Vanilla planifolia]|uniref:Uncharacterized protein n=1 Tax=Vanilla planifolia TaxID=51239 RepID=A0A835S2G1_VANPL|nr:hypothetical protein HPP92_002981 [Vanilla planifolia]